MVIEVSEGALTRRRDAGAPSYFRNEMLSVEQNETCPVEWFGILPTNGSASFAECGMDVATISAIGKVCVEFFHKIGGHFVAYFPSGHQKRFGAGFFEGALQPENAFARGLALPGLACGEHCEAQSVKVKSGDVVGGKDAVAQVVGHVFAAPGGIGTGESESGERHCVGVAFQVV